MLITTMIGLRMTDDLDRQPNGRELLMATVGAKLALTSSLIGPVASCTAGEVAA